MLLYINKRPLMQHRVVVFFVFFYLRLGIKYKGVGRDIAVCN